jgi:hypothetical protein
MLGGSRLLPLLFVQKAIAMFQADLDNIPDESFKLHRFV